MLSFLDYMLWKPIEKGSFGLVWQAKVLRGAKKDEMVAIKIINLDDYQGKNIEETKVIFQIDTIREK